MALSTSQLKQVVSARVTGVGATSTHVIGGTNTITDDVDIAFGFTMKCGHADNSVILNYRDGYSSNKPTLEHSSGANTTINCDQKIGAFESQEIIEDPTFTDIAAITTIVAIYFEAPASNNGTISIAGTPNDIGDVDFSAAGGSFLLTPRFTNTTSAKHVIDFNAIGDILKVIVLGKGA